MKKLEVIIRTEKIEQLRDIFEQEDVSGFNVINVMGSGRHNRELKQYRGASYRVNLVSNVKIETVVEEVQAQKLIERITKEISTGTEGDGKIFIYDVVDVISIKNGGHGDV